MTRRIRNIAWTACVALLSTNAISQDATTSQIVSQTKIGPNGCGPCALVNSLNQAKASQLLAALDGPSDIEKVRSFIDTYGGAPSEKYGPRRTMYSDKNGICDNDMVRMLNRFATKTKTPGFAGQVIERTKDEKPAAFVKRFHQTVQDSIESGFHPLLSVRAIAAEYSESHKAHQWNSKGGHFVAIHAVGDISPDGVSLPITFSDSISGKMQTGLVFIELNRNAKVPITFTVDEHGKEQWRWISNTTTLTLSSPGMPIGTKRAKWNERTFIALRYVIVQATQ